MQYNMPVQVRYSEVGKNGKVSLHKILEYFQDCSIFHSESLGYTVEKELKIHRGWFLLSWNVEIERFPSMSEHLNIVTEPYKMRGFYGYRRFMMYDENDNLIAHADSLWLLMNLEKMIPQKVPAEMTEAYIKDVNDSRIRVTRKLPEDGDWITRDQIVINRHYLDSNSHVNNTYYALWAEEFLPKDLKMKKVMIDYRQSTFHNDIITVDTICEEDCYRCRFTNQEGKLIALVEIHSS